MSMPYSLWGALNLFELGAPEAVKAYDLTAPRCVVLSWCKILLVATVVLASQHRLGIGPDMTAPTMPLGPDMGCGWK